MYSKENSDKELNLSLKKIPIVFAADEKYAVYTSISIQSIIDSASNANIYEIILLVGNGFSEILKDKMHQMIKEYDNFTLRFIEIGDMFDTAKIHIKHITTPTFYRLLLPELLPEYDKCIYIDGDTMVCQDIKEFYEYDLGDAYVAGVRAYGYYNRVEHHRERLGLPTFDLYINAGSILMNLHEMRKNNWVDQAMNLLQKDFSCQDQDIINVSCYGKILELPYQYNLMTKYDEWNEEDFENIGVDYRDILAARAKPVIIHYADKTKPWNCFYVQESKKWWIMATMGQLWDELVENKVISDERELKAEKDAFVSRNKELAEQNKRQKKEKDESIKKLQKEKDESIKKLQKEKDESIKKLQKEKDESIKKLQKEKDEGIRKLQREKDDREKKLNLEIGKLNRSLSAKEKESTRQKEDIINLTDSLSFKIGCTITFIPRKLRGGFRCLRDNGLRYTVAHFCTKVKNKLGHK